MKVLIVEDEILLAKQLKKILLDVEPSATVSGICHSVEETVQWLETHEAPDIILLDIELADGQSFEIFNRTTVKPPVIFTTAYDEYAVKAFKLNSIDYLLKPIQEEELKASIDKFKNTKAAHNSFDKVQLLLDEIKRLQQPLHYKDRLLVKQGQKLISIETDDIAYIFSENGASFLRTWQNQKYILSQSLDDLEQSLSPKLFFRANRQHIIHHKSVVAIHTWFNQKLKVEVIPPTAEHIIVSREKANEFKEWMGE